MHFPLFLITLTLGLATSRPVWKLPQGGQTPGARFVMVIRLASMVATFSMIALGFYLYAWWVPIASFLIIATLLTFVINRKTRPFFLKVDPLLGGATILLASYCWYSSTVG
jgi:hypothetical protein